MMQIRFHDEVLGDTSHSRTVGDYIKYVAQLIACRQAPVLNEDTWVDINEDIEDAIYGFQAELEKIMNKHIAKIAMQKAVKEVPPALILKLLQDVLETDELLPDDQAYKTAVAVKEIIDRGKMELYICPNMSVGDVSCCACPHSKPHTYDVSLCNHVRRSSRCADCVPVEVDRMINLYDLGMTGVENENS